MPLTPEEQKRLEGYQTEFGGLSPDEIVRLQEHQEVFEEEGSFDRLGQAMTRRGTQAKEASRRFKAGEIGRPEYIYQMAGQAGAGIVGDVAGEVISESIGGYKELDRLTGGYGAKLLGGITGAVGSLPSFGGGTIGEVIPGEMAGLARGYEEFAQEHPRAAANIEATVNLPAMMIPAVKYGEDIIDAGTGAIKTISKKRLDRLTSEEVRERAGKLYTLAEEKGGGVKPEFWQQYMDDIQREMTPKSELGEKMQMAAGDRDTLSKMVEAMKSVQENPQSLAAITEADKMLGDLAQATMDIKGTYTKAGKDYLMMQRKLRDSVRNAPEELFTGGTEGFKAIEEGRKMYAAAHRLDDVERIIHGAVDKAQPATIIKNGFIRLRNDKAKMRRFSPEEQFAIRKAAKTGTLEAFVRLSGSGLGPLILGGAGFGAGGAYGGVGGFLGGKVLQEASKGMASRMATGKGNKVLESVISTATGQPAPYMTPQMLQLMQATGKVVAPIGAVGASYDESLSARARRIMEARSLRRAEQSQK